MDILIFVASVGALIAFGYGHRATDDGLKADAYGTGVGMVAITAMLALLNLFLFIA